MHGSHAKDVGRRQRYVEKAVSEQCAAVASAGRGLRNPRLNQAAFRLGQFVAAGDLDADEARLLLHEAATSSGLVADDGRTSVRATIESGLRDGAKAPAQVPVDAAPGLHLAAAAAAEDIQYPAQCEVDAVFSMSGDVLTDASVRLWLSERGIDAAEVSRLDLARVAATGAAYPPCALTKQRKVPIPAKGYRLVVPLYDANGVRRSVLFRRAGEGAHPKSLAAQGKRKRLVMADTLALHMLRKGAWPLDWRADPRVLVAEGETDFLRAATWWHGRRDRPATIGIVAGSWSQQLTERLPFGTTVVIATDDDLAGDEYAAKIVDSCSERATNGELHLERFRPQPADAEHAE